MEEELNPYAAPQSNIFAGPPDAKYTRLAHLDVESNLKALGVLWLWLGLFFPLAVIDAMTQGKAFLGEIVAVVVLGFVGAGLCRLRRWAWILCLVFSAAWLLLTLASFPEDLLGVVIMAFILRFLLREKTRRIMDEDYPSIIAATPELHSPVAKWGWWVTGIFTLLAAVSYLRIFFGWW